jgi:hypothetical protein
MVKFHLKPIDARGRRIRKGDLVRVIGIPDLSTLHPEGRAETEPVFLHIRGTCKRIDEFNGHGLAELLFKVRAGPLAGWHSVAIEPNLLLRQNARNGA